ncbi:MAG: transposase, partial [Proteobacteria bacterium]|nr:transposase [Pseudomonadota bacterium]
MARPLRIEYPGAVYHVTARGNAQAAIYLDDADRRSFLDTLALAIERHAWLCHGYCLMDNHYHLLIETPTANLGRGMRHINGVYTQAFNRRHGRVGHLFQGRYKAILVEREAYLLELARYVVLNPVRAKLAGIKAASDWPWSSHRAVAGEAAAPDWLTVAWLRRQFGGDDATKAYRRFVADGMADRRSPLADGLQGR